MGVGNPTTGLTGVQGVTNQTLNGKPIDSKSPEGAKAILDNMVKLGNALQLPDGSYVSTKNSAAANSIIQGYMKVAQPATTQNPYQNPGSTPNPGTNYSLLPPITSPNPQQNQNTSLADQYTNAILPSAGQTTTNPAGGLSNLGTKASADAQQLLAEAELQKSLYGQSIEAQKADRAKSLDDLSKILATQQQQAFDTSRPEIYEDMNTRGLLRSSGLGEAFARKQAELTGQTSNQLALQGLNDRNTILGQQDTAEQNYLGARGGAIARQFSLEDYANQVATAQKLGFNVPQQQQAQGGKNASSTVIPAAGIQAIGTVAAAGK